MLTQPMPIALRSGRKPQVLDRTDGRIGIHARIVGPPEHDAAAARRIAGHADAERRPQDAFELQRTVFVAALPVEHLCRLAVCAVEGLPHLLPDGLVAHQNEIPGLHEADRWRVVSCLQQSPHNVVGQGIGQKLIAHVAPGHDRPVDRIAFFTVKGRRARKRVVIQGSHRQIPNNATARRPRGSVYLVRPVF